MKKTFWAVMLLLSMFTAAGTALAQETAFYTITYHSNLENSDYTTSVDKEPGQTIEIDSCHYGMIGQIFAGWSADPDAETADYLPGDTYSKDENLELYAVWMDAYELGEINGPADYVIPAFPVPNESIYISFTVAETDDYRLQSMDESMKAATSFSSIHIIRIDGNNWEKVSTGEYIKDESYLNLDFTVAAHLEAGAAYLLEFVCPPNAVKLNAENRISFVTYHSNLGENNDTSTVSKGSGESIQIEECSFGMHGLIFAGWATTPDADAADYLPGDVYSGDEDLDLYAVWMDAYDLGVIEAGESRVIPPFPVTDETVYLQFSVAESGYYCLQSEDGSLKNSSVFSGIKISYQNGTGWETVSRGEYITDVDGRVLDFSVAAKLEANVTYLLSFIAPPDPVKLKVQDDLYFITYHSNLSDNDDVETVKKEAGKAIVIDQCRYGWTGLIFAGWAVTPDASKADYLPGDVYETDASLEVYAVWQDAYDLGFVTGKETWKIPAFPVSNEQVYLKLIVSESGFYRLRTIEESLKSGSSYGSISILCHNGIYWQTISRGEYIMNEYYQPLDLTVSAELEADTVYYMSFYCPADSITLLIEPQFSNDACINSAEVPASVKVVETEMFAGTALESIYIPAGVERIEADAFKDCTLLTKAVIASDDVRIDQNAFRGCSGLLIVAPEESTANSFAKQNNYEFSCLNKE